MRWIEPCKNLQEIEITVFSEVIGLEALRSLPALKRLRFAYIDQRVAMDQALIGHLQANGVAVLLD